MQLTQGVEVDQPIIQMPLFCHDDVCHSQAVTKCVLLFRFPGALRDHTSPASSFHCFHGEY